MASVFAFEVIKMKKLSWITGILVFVMVLLAALGSVCGAVDQIAADENFYSGMSRAAVMKYLGVEDDPQAGTKVSEYIGMTDGEQTAFAGEMAAFMRGETDAQPAVLNEEERQHMLDVRNLTQTAGGMSRTYLTAAAVLAVIAAWTGAKLRRRMLPKLIGGLGAVSVIMLLVQGVMNEVASGGFAQLFVQMHETLFTNDLWLMDPATDILIRMMPQPLFEQALLNGASIALRMLVIVLVMLFAVNFIIESMLHKHVAKGE